MSKPAKAIGAYAFIRTVLGVRLTSGQAALVKVMADRIDPIDLDADQERDAAAVMFGAEVDRIPPDARRVCTVVAGRGSSKSYLTALLALYYAITSDLSMLAAGEHGHAIVIAPTRALARQILNYVKGAIDDNATLRGMVTRTTQHEIELKRPDGREVTICIVPADKGGSSARGKSIVFGCLEETAFFESEGAAVVDKDLLRAIKPRLLPGAPVFVISTPWAKRGLLWTLFDRNWNGPRDSIVAWAASTLLLNLKRVRTAVAAEWQADPDNARIELGSLDGKEGPQFQDDSTSQYFGSDLIAQSVIDDPPEGVTYERKVAACDLAFKADGSALAIVGVRPDGTTIALDTLELKPNKRKGLLPSAVIADFASVLKKHGIPEVFADSHSREAAREEFAKHGITLRDAPNSHNRANTECHATVRGLFLEGRIKIPTREQALLRQLREITAKPLEGGIIKFSKPRRAGEHGDLGSAFILAASQAFARRGLSDRDCHIIGVGTRAMNGKLTGRNRDRRDDFELPDGSTDWDAFDAAEDALASREGTW
jgi:hypothetical protein